MSFSRTIELIIVFSVHYSMTKVLHQIGI